MARISPYDAVISTTPVKRPPKPKSPEQLGKIIDGHIKSAMEKMAEGGRPVNEILKTLLEEADQLRDIDTKARIIFGFLNAASKYSVQQIEQTTNMNVRVSAEPMSVEDWQQQAKLLNG